MFVKLTRRDGTEMVEIRLDLEKIWRYGPTKTTGPDRTDYFGNTVIEYSTTSVCVEETPEQLDVLLNAMTVKEYEDEIVKSQEYMHSGLSGAQE
jgi:hypothetical protein